MGGVGSIRSNPNGSSPWTIGIENSREIGAEDKGIGRRKCQVQVLGCRLINICSALR